MNYGGNVNNAVPCTSTDAIINHLIRSGSELNGCKDQEVEDNANLYVEDRVKDKPSTSCDKPIFADISTEGTACLHSGIVDSSINKTTSNTNSATLRLSHNSSCKRKPASPKKRPAGLQEVVKISAETGELVDECSSASIMGTIPNENGESDSRKLIEKPRRKRIKNESIFENVAKLSQASNISTSLADIKNLAALINSFSGGSNSDIVSSVNKDMLSSSKANNGLVDEQRNGCLLNGFSLANIANTLYGVENAAALNAMLSAILMSGGNLADTSNVVSPELLSADNINAFASSDFLSLSAGILPFLNVGFSGNSLDDHQASSAGFLEAALAATARETGHNLSQVLGTTDIIATPSSLSDTASSFNFLDSNFKSSVRADKASFLTASSMTAEARLQGARTKSKTSNGVAQGLKAGSDVDSALNANILSSLGDNSTIKRRIQASDEESIQSVARAITREDRVDLEELESFAQTFKRQRIKFGFTQGDVGLALGRRYGTDFSQTTISRFEALNLSFKNMCKLRPLLKEWLADAESAIANGASVSDLLEASPKETVIQSCEPVVGISASNSDRSVSPTTVGTGNVPLRKRRKRTNLDVSQRASLDAYFNFDPRPDHEKMAHIAEVLDLDRDVVRVWFCNRRQKLRKV